MDDSYDHMRVAPLPDGAPDVPLPRQFTPTFSLAFLRTCEEGAMLINPQGRITFLNEAAQRILGLPDISGTPQAEWWDLFPTEFDGVIRHALDRVGAGEAIQFPVTLSEPESGIPRQWTIMASPVVNSDSQVETVFSIIVAQS